MTPAPPSQEVAMTPIEADIARYLQWMEVHNYAATTVDNRRRYLAYFAAFATERGVDDATAVTLELLVAYQHQLFAHRKRDGAPLSFATQAQRLVPVAQFFSWPTSATSPRCSATRDSRRPSTTPTLGNCIRRARKPRWPDRGSAGIGEVVASSTATGLPTCGPNPSDARSQPQTGEAEAQ
jgi:hypothetical protein